MIHIRKIMLALAVTAGSGVIVMAQTNGSNSPYSRYGFGLLSDRAQGFNKGMSGLSYGMSNGTELNTKNPASYAKIDSLSFLFDIGVTLQQGTLSQGSNKVNAKNTSFDYLSLGFRAAPNLGVSLGFMPFSTIGYSLSTTDDLRLPSGNEITQTESYQGDGGLREAYAGIGWSPIKPLSIGVNAGMLWGSMTHTVMASFSDATISSRRRQYDADITTYTLDFGGQYTVPIKPKHDLILGITYGLGHDIKSDGHYYDQKVSSGSVASGDTLTARNAFQLPHTLGIGAVWSYDNRLRAGIDYTFQRWSDVKTPVVKESAGGQKYEAATGQFTDMHKVTLGMEYLPSNNGVRWRDFVRYRAGFSYTSPYAKIDGKKGPRSYAASIGVGLPILNYYNNRSIVNISAQYERVEPQLSGMVTENYFRICIGLSFNERWFMKWKVE